MKFLPLLATLTALGLVIGGCSKQESAPAAAGGHQHAAPHGGTLVEVGEHAYNIELVREAATGKMSAYVLDGHAENFVRITAPTLEVIAFTGGQRRSIVLRAVPNSGTGETVGDTSQFEGQADWLKQTDKFPGAIPLVEIRGSKFANVSLYFRS
ncbi:MAG: hypothetical protein RIQ93_1551 [Verrucomicrobiota bacterium]|jgi:hypothetical protein